MKITQLIASNFAGRNFQHDLKAMNLIVGQNFSHKSSLANIVRIGLLGYHPRLGKTQGATWQFAGQNANEMNIDLIMSEGKPCRHTLKRSTKGAISQSSEMPFELPVVLLDTQDYFQRTAADRVKYIFEKIDPVAYGFSDIRLLDTIRKIEVVPVLIGTQGVTEVITLIEASIGYRKHMNLSHQQWMDKLIVELKDRLKEYTADWKRLGTSVQSKKAMLPANKPQSVQGEIQEIKLAKGHIETQISEFHARAEAWARTNIRRKELEAIISQNDGPAPASSLKREITELEKATTDFKSNTPALEKEFGTLRGNHQALTKQGTQLESQITLIEEKITELAQRHSCPYCKSSDGNWKDTLKKDYEAQLREANSKSNDLAGQLRDLVQAGLKQRTILEKSKLADLAQAKTFEALRVKRATLSQLDNQNACTVAALAELSGLNQQSGTEPAQVDLTELKIWLGEYNQKLSGLDARHQQCVNWDAIVQSMDQLERDYTRAFTFAEVFKLAIKETIAVQEALVATAFGAILKKATALTDGILKAKLDYQDGELGMMSPEGWVSHKTFSGTEELLAYAGLSVALAQDSPIKIVILDELGRLQPENKVKLMNRMQELIQAGTIDQFIGIDVSTQDYPIVTDQINVITP